MKAMILAAGYGTRMRPLTDTTPKPLLQVAGKPLLQYHLERLREAGFRDLVINLAHLGEQIEARYGDGRGLGLNICYSRESEPLETGGAILQALPLLGEAPFVLVNGDVWSDYPFLELRTRQLPPAELGRLVLVQNPPHNPQGDFSLRGGRLLRASGEGYTFSGISLLRPQLVSECAARRRVFPLRDAFAEAIDRGRLGGELHRGQWWDIGTPERLAALDAHLRG